MTEGRPRLLPALLLPSASQALMQLVVNSSRSCFTVYFSGLKKKNQKLKKKSLKSKIQREEAVTFFW